jgi:2,3-bisphosphoglycerate-dependent phosphoglycerate mutase
MLPLAPGPRPPRAPAGAGAGRHPPGQIFRAHYATAVATTSEDQPQAQPVYRQSGFPHFPGAVDFLLIRHGESQPYTPGNPFPLAAGHGDPPLAPEGHEQAKLLAGRLASARIDAIYVTSLRRTAQTAAPLAERLGLTPVVEPELREVHLGDWEAGEYRQRVAEQDPVVREAFTKERWDVIPGAEASATFSARVRGAIERIAAAHHDQQVAVFVHGGVIGEVLAQASGSRPFAFLTADNASISRLVVSGDRWFVRGFNDVAHLER